MTYRLESRGTPFDYWTIDLIAETEEECLMKMDELKELDPKLGFNRIKYRIVYERIKEFS